MKTNDLNWPVFLFLLFAAVTHYSCTASLPESVKVAYDQLPEEIDYNVHVQPILSDRCYQCHGPDENTRKAGLRLDMEEDAFKKLESGKRAFLRGSVSQSESIHRLLSDDPDYQMPPPETELSMSPREIAIIVKWLEQGAEWKPHWSFIPIEKPEVPKVLEDQLTYNEIDYFIQRKIVEEGLMPNESAEKERLLRRVTMDLTGLPPSIDEMDAFLEDSTNDAYETVVDRLLASTDHAERVAIEWMDVAR